MTCRTWTDREVVLLLMAHDVAEIAEKWNPDNPEWPRLEWLSRRIRPLIPKLNEARGRHVTAAWGATANRDAARAQLKAAVREINRAFRAPAPMPGVDDALATAALDARERAARTAARRARQSRRQRGA